MIQTSTHKFKLPWVIVLSFSNWEKDQDERNGDDQNAFHGQINTQPLIYEIDEGKLHSLAETRG